MRALCSESGGPRECDVNAVKMRMRWGRNFTLHRPSSTAVIRSKSTRKFLLRSSPDGGQHAGGKRGGPDRAAHAAHARVQGRRLTQGAPVCDGRSHGARVAMANASRSSRITTSTRRSCASSARGRARPAPLAFATTCTCACVSVSVSPRNACIIREFSL